MRSSARKRLSAMERRERILRAAVRAFAADGFDGASMDRIALQAQISKPVLYDHFASKHALYSAVLEGIRDRLLARGEAIREIEANPARQARQSIEAFFRFVEDEPDAARVLLATPHDSAAAAASRRVQEGASDGIARLLADFAPVGETWRLLAASEFMKGGLHALARRWLDKPDWSREGLVDVAMDIAWDGLQRHARNGAHRGAKRGSSAAKGAPHGAT